MDTTIPLGRIAGIPIRAHWSVLVGVVVVALVTSTVALPDMAPAIGVVAYWSGGVLAGIGLFGSVLAHELAHALVARRKGLEVRRISLWLLGGLSELVGEPSAPGAEVRVALAGPVASVGLAGVFFLAALGVPATGALGLVGALLSWLGAMNVMLGLFNLLPGYPLDGGRVLHGLCWWYSGDRNRATRAASGAGRAIGALIGALGFLLVLNGRLDGFWLVGVGWFISLAATAEQATSRVRRRLTGKTVGEVMTPAPDLAPGWWTVRALSERIAAGALPRHEAYPVVDFDGRLLGAVSIGDLERLDEDAALTKTVREMARPLPATRVLSPATPAEQLLVALAAGSRLVVVVERDRVVGLVTATDLRWATLGDTRDELVRQDTEDSGRRPT